MRHVHIKFIRDMLPSEGGWPAGTKLVLPAEIAATSVAAGDAIYLDDATFPAPPFRGLPPPIPEPRKRPANRQ